MVPQLRTIAYNDSTHLVFLARSALSLKKGFLTARPLLIARCGWLRERSSSCDISCCTKYQGIWKGWGRGGGCRAERGCGAGESAFMPASGSVLSAPRNIPTVEHEYLAERIAPFPTTQPPASRCGSAPLGTSCPCICPACVGVGRHDHRKVVKGSGTKYLVHTCTVEQLF